MKTATVPIDVWSKPDAVSLAWQRTRALHTWSVLFPIAWGVLLFGAVYPWAYVPLLIMAAAVGAYGWATATPRARAPLRGVVIALLLVLAVILVQQIPLPADWLAMVSPHSETVARQYDLAYGAARASGGRPWRPISIAPESTLGGTAIFAALGLWLVGVTVLVPRLRLEWLIRRLAGLGLALAVLGIVQKGTFNGRLYWVWSPIEIASNAFGPFVNRNHFAGWMLMTGALVAGYLCSLAHQRNRGRRRRSWREHIAALASTNASRLLFVSCALAVMALSIVWTMSRSGIGAFAVATSLLAALVGVRFRGSRRTATVGWLLAIVLFALWWKGLDTMADWYSRTSTLEWRVQLWRDTSAIIRDFRWFGTGLNTYGVSTLLYPMTDRSWHAMEAHSDYVQIASEGGLALGAAAAWLAWQVARGIRAAFVQPQSSSTYWIRVGATLGLVAIAVQELSDFSLQMPGNAVLFAVLAAVALHRPRRSRPQSASKHDPPPAVQEADAPTPVMLMDLDVAFGAASPPDRPHTDDALDEASFQTSPFRNASTPPTSKS